MTQNIPPRCYKYKEKIVYHKCGKDLVGSLVQFTISLDRESEKRFSRKEEREKEKKRKKERRRIKRTKPFKMVPFAPRLYHKCGKLFSRLTNNRNNLTFLFSSIMYPIARRNALGYYICTLREQMGYFNQRVLISV